MNNDKKKRIVMLADCQSFYASVEKAAHPEYANRPLAVAGDPARRSGIILAACPLAKQYGVTTAESLGEALKKCPDLVLVRPHMQEYINVSLQITEIFQSYTDLVEPYSIDEQFLDITGSLKLFGNPIKIATSIQQKVMNETGIYIRIGMSENKVLSKMACDNFAKKNHSGIFTLHKEELQETLWRLPVQRMFMVGSRMRQHLKGMGIFTIGQLAQTPLSKLREKWGVNGEVLWLIANGQDFSPVKPAAHDVQKAIGHQMTLPFDFCTLDEIKVPLLELSELVCQRMRAKGYMGWVVSVDCQGADFNHPHGFHRQMKLFDPTNLTNEVYEAATTLFQRNWDGQPIRKIGITLSQLISDHEYQLTLFDNREQKLLLERTIDRMKEKYGNAVIMRASSLKRFGQARERAQKIGGHTK
ncbi:DNA polymerase-4 [Cytobacillus eiseniae]|uniref:DNA polymerase IV n=1 Tax=Cytobacillus eiseniae TaxID=762947 RepID=A0ABS4RDH3_9BACI|nr:DNA polymerase IV [Cytobacillus eiseniae]MBP2240773.1 DNA polymerase-4 [Cytobacillus eiseniae]